jgi:hypothetical protein
LHRRKHESLKVLLVRADRPRRLPERGKAKGDEFVGACSRVGRLRVGTCGMSIARSIAAVGLAAAASVLLSVGLPMAVSSEPEAIEGEVFVEWVLQPASVGELVDASTSVVEAEVVAVENGPSVANGAVGTQIVELDTLRHLSGAEVPTTFTLSSIGNPDAAPVENPPFEVGQAHVLFLRPMPQGPADFVAAAPEGRLDEATGQSFASPVEGTPMADAFDGESAQEIESAVSAVEGGAG